MENKKTQVKHLIKLPSGAIMLSNKCVGFHRGKLNSTRWGFFSAFFVNFVFNQHNASADIKCWTLCTELFRLQPGRERPVCFGFFLFIKLLDANIDIF